MSKRIDNYDELSDPDNPQTIKFEDIQAALGRIRPYVPVTPIIPSHQSKAFTMNIIYKMESVLPSGSHKERGAVNALLKIPRDKRKGGLVIASLGNHAYSMSYHAARLNIPVTALFPDSVPIQKLQKIHTLGTKVLVRGSQIVDTHKCARAMAKEKGLLFMNGRDHPDILAGLGTVGLEILEQVPNADAVLVPVGTGGLIGGIGTVIKRLKPNCLVYGIQSEVMPVFAKALEAGEPVTVPEVNTIADCLQVTRAGVNAFHNAKSVIDKMLLVKEDWIARAILALIEQERFVVEGAGACPLAAIIGHMVPELKTKTVVCLVTGGNIDTRFLARCIDRGLAAEGRLIKFRMRIVVEGRNMEHSLELKRTLDRAYPGLTTFDTEPFNDKSMCPCYVAKM
ncbi:L-threonine ammonia-lyase-like isoform X2 [Leguminivora glycinivorella]|uniref:L-threonine ammonia-lyase-like isoform X2 n=1 Tax=Leguminivora glycinivorella TaxID=1035111 RepID=UPI0020106C72|nr:L-threonine ammonia-lyase-like isoform X2 [Leguminivora glycinivorella]